MIDSTADLPDFADRFANLRMVPLNVRFGDEPELRDHIDLDADAFYARLALASELPRTSAPSPQAFADCYQRAARRPLRARRLCPHLGQALGHGAGRAARRRAARRPRHRDRHGLGLGRGRALRARRRAPALARASSVADLVAYGERFTRDRPRCFSVETLDYLQRGGRIGRAQALVGGLLGVRPILGIVDGEVEPLARVRGASRCSPRCSSSSSAATAPRHRAARRDRARAGARAGRGARTRHRGVAAAGGDRARRAARPRDRDVRRPRARSG